MTILPSGSVYFAIKGKKWQNSLSKAFSIDALQKVGYFLKIWGNALGKIPQNQGQFLPSPKSGEVLQELTQNQKCFYPICKNPLRLTSE